MIKVFKLIFLFVASFSAPLHAQWYFACTGDQKLYKLNADGCDTIFIGTSSTTLNDIALTPDGTLYGINFTSLFEIDTSNGTLHTIIDSLHIWGVNSLVSDEEGRLLAVGMDDSIYEIDRFTGQVFSLGYLGYSSAGDLTFYKGHLYLSEFSGKLVRITLHPVISALIIGNIALPISDIFGLNTLCINGQETLIASKASDNSLYTINPRNASITPLCDSILPRWSTIFGMATPWDSKNCFVTHDNGMPVVYPNPVTDVLKVSYQITDPVVIKIFDAASRLIWKESFINSLLLNMETFATGVYLFQIENSRGPILQGKIIKMSQ